MAVLELSAVDFDNCTRTPYQCFGSCLDYTRFTRAGWSQEEEIADRSARRCQARKMQLINADDFLYCFVLANYPRAQPCFE